MLSEVARAARPVFPAAMAVSLATMAPQSTMPCSPSPAHTMQHSVGTDLAIRTNGTHKGVFVGLH